MYLFVSGVYMVLLFLNKRSISKYMLLWNVYFVFILFKHFF